MIRTRQLFSLAILSVCSVLLSFAAPAAGQPFEGERFPALFDTHGLAVNDDDTSLYMVSEFNSIAEVDLRTNLFLRAFPVGADARQSSGLAYSRGKLFIVEQDGTVVMDAESEAVLAVVPHPATLGLFKGAAVASEDGSRIYTVYGSSRAVSVIDADTHELVQSIDVGRDYVSIALSPTNDRIYIVNPETTELTILSTETFEVERSTPFANPVGTLDILTQVTTGPDGRVYVSYVTSDYRGKIGVFTPAGDTLGVFPLPGYSTGVACSPDGLYLASGSGYVVDTQDGAVIDHVPTPFVGIYHVIFSNGGDRAFLSNDNDRFINAIRGFVDRPEQVVVTGRASVGDSLEVTLDFPGEGGNPYQLAASVGISRGIRVGPHQLFPLDYDTLFRLTINPRTRECVSFKGTLEEDGTATARFDFSHHAPGVPAGTTIFFAAASFDGRIGRDRLRTVSNVVQVVTE